MRNTLALLSAHGAGLAVPLLEIQYGRGIPAEGLQVASVTST